MRNLGKNPTEEEVTLPFPLPLPLALALPLPLPLPLPLTPNLSANPNPDPTPDPNSNPNPNQACPPGKNWECSCCRPGIADAPAEERRATAFFKKRRDQLPA